MSKGLLEDDEGVPENLVKPFRQFSFHDSIKLAYKNNTALIVLKNYGIDE